MEYEYKLRVYRGKYCIYWKDSRGRSIRRSLNTSDPETAKRRHGEFLLALDLRRRSRGYTITDLWNARRKALGDRRLASNMEWSSRSILPFFGHLIPSELTQEKVQEYSRQRGRAQGTVWTELNHLRMTLNWARKTGLIESVPYFTLPVKPPPKADYLTKEQFRGLIEAAESPHLRLFCILAVTTGARSSALFDLTWDRVDLVRRTIDLRVPSNIERKGRAVVPINDTLLAELQRAKEIARSSYVIEYDGQRISSVRTSLSKASIALCVGFRITPHVFRHSAAVWMAEAGVPMEEIAQYLGHSDVSVTRKVYARFSPDYLRKAANALEI